MRHGFTALAFFVLLNVTHLSANSLPVAEVKTQAASATGGATASWLNLSGTSNPYGFSCVVSGARIGGVSGPAGTVTFNDVTAKQVLGSATLGTPSFSLLEKVIDGPAAGLSPYLATGDFNGDGLLDMAFISPGVGGENSTVLVYFGNGDGTFRTPVSSPAGTATGQMAAGDFNGDGKLDLAIGSPQPANNDPLTDGITILLGNGDGTFQAPKLYGPYGQYALFSGGFAVGDFNGDGKKDIAFAIPESAGSTVYSLKILFGTASGVFQAPVTSQLSVVPTSFIAQDFNGDGRQDLLTVDKSGELSLFLSNGDGTFQMSTVGSYTNATVGDFNGDGKLDIATIKKYSGILILLGNGNGTFQVQPTTYPATDGEASILAAADFNGDGHADLLVDQYELAESTAGILFGNGDGTFQAAANFPLYIGSSYSLTAADFQGEGFADLVGLTPGGVEILQNGKGASAAISATVLPGTATNHLLDCSYAGNANYAASSSDDREVTFQQAPSPVLSLATGNYTAAQTLSMTDSNVKAVISYTTDGSTPTINSTPYTAPITVSATETVKAVANVAGVLTQSAVAEAAYTIDNQAPAPVFSPAAGTYYGTQSVSLSDPAAGAKIYYTTNGSAPTAASALYSGPIQVSATEALRAIAIATGYNPSGIASATYTIVQPSAAPIFSVAAGSYGSEQLVSLKDVTPGASIYYTLDGTAPSEASARYSVPLVVASSETVKALATAPGYGVSTTASATYVVAGAPSSLIVPASALGSSGATLNAIVTPQGVASTYSFAYGTSKTELTSSTTTVKLAAASGSESVSAVLTGLKSGTTYYFDVTVTTVGGTSTSAIISFTTE